MGYIPLNHQTRLGDHTVSWYRGPLVPYPIPETKPKEKFSADAYVHFDPTTGLLDVSYAAAFQLGQLLTLQNKSMAVRVYQWKRELNQTWTKEALKRGYRKMDDLHAILTNPQFYQDDPLPLPLLPLDLMDWVANLILLKGIPFHYLVPNERLLPSESLRFFTLDLNWIQSLIYGVFSVGAQTPTTLTQLSTFLPKVFEQAKMHAKKLRPHLFGTEASDDPLITGLLLRSEVVSGWPGLEIVGQDDKQNVISKIRFESLSPNILICLFSGVPSFVIFKEPPEGVHFGIEEGNPLQKYLKYPLSSTKRGQQDSNIPPVTVNVRKEDSTVIDIKTFLSTIENNLKLPPLSVSDFALQMTQGVESVKFEIQKQEKNNVAESIARVLDSQLSHI